MGDPLCTPSVAGPPSAGAHGLFACPGCCEHLVRAPCGRKFALPSVRRGLSCSAVRFCSRNGQRASRVPRGAPGGCSPAAAGGPQRGVLQNRRHLGGPGGPPSPPSLGRACAAGAAAPHGRGPLERWGPGGGWGRRLSRGQGGVSGIFWTPRWGSHMLSRLDSAGGHVPSRCWWSAQAPLPGPGAEFTQPRFWS